MRQRISRFAITVSLSSALFAAGLVVPAATLAQTCAGYNNRTATQLVNWKIATSAGGAALFTGWIKMSVNYSWNGSFCTPYPVQTDTHKTPGAGIGYPSGTPTHNNGGIFFSDYDYRWRSDWHIREGASCEHYINFSIEADDDNGNWRYVYNGSGETSFGIGCGSHKIYVTSP